MEQLSLPAVCSIYEGIVRQRYRDLSQLIAIQHHDKPNELYKQFQDIAENRPAGPSGPQQTLSAADLRTVFGAAGIMPQLIPPDLSIKPTETTES